ncbi:NACHT and WD repeat domain-containing protein [Actinomadura fibrosa]|uniref:NACHT and WD repeat domain-containing protein n=1 Tax=Actinomadura fibrosa TaxID=111802 RepID=A0ABW2XNN0_9ACTN|nr:WD40 repeat domain-containing protein [Actinomadura fibrosa]
MAEGSAGAECPYQGLAPFESGKAGLFFGRTRATRDLLGRLGPRLEGRGSVLLVSGASGVGKSSLLRAGLLPALAKGELQVAGVRGWASVLVTPTSKPLAALAEAWAEAFGGPAEAVRDRLLDDPRKALADALPPDDRLVLVVDQFEELFLLVTDERERQEYVRTLHALAEGPRGAGVVVGVRADYWDRCAAYPQFAEAIQDGQVIVEPMAEEDLRLAITGPAAAVGMEIEPGLVDTILAELRTGRAAGDRYEPGALPLLSQALRNTWERREDGRLTVRGYEESGGVRDSVRRTAEEVLSGLPAEDRKTALRLFRRMTLITAGGRLARRRASLPELHAAADAGSAERRARVGALLSGFAGRRLLTLHEEAAEISHDALLTAWPALRQWIEPDLAAQEVYDRLAEDAAEWAERHRDAAFLYRGARLLAVDDSRPRWERDPDAFPPLGPTADAFVATSVRAARRTARRRRLVMAGLAVLSVLALIAAGAAVSSARSADHQRRLAVSRQLAAQTDASDDPVVTSLLAVAAYRIAPTPEARHRLLDLAARPERGLLLEKAQFFKALVASPVGPTLAVAEEDGTIRLWDTARHRQLGAPITPPKDAVCNDVRAAFSSDGKVLAATCFTTVFFWDVATHRQVGAPIQNVDGVWSMKYSPDGRTLVTGSYEGTVRFFDVATRRQIGRALGRRASRGEFAVRALAFTPDGRRLVSAGSDDTARLWDVATHRQVGKPFTGHGEDVLDAAVSPDGRTLATTGNDHGARLWDLATHERIGVPAGKPDDARFYDGIAFSPDGTRFMTWGSDGYIRLWDTVTRRPVGQPLLNGLDSPLQATYLADGTLAAIAHDGVLRLWDPEVGRPIGTTMPASTMAVFSPDGRTLAALGPGQDLKATDADRAARLYDVATQRRIGDILRPVNGPGGPAETPYLVQFGAGGRTVFTDGLDGALRVWDTATQRQIGPPVYQAQNRLRTALSPDGRLLVLDRSEEGLAFWDLAGRREVGHRIVDADRYHTPARMVFSPDGTTLAVTRRDRGVRLHAVPSGRLIGTPLAGATDDDYYSAMAFSPDGRILASTVDRDTVKLWDVASHRQIGAPLTGHTDQIGSVAFSPDGRILATSSADDTVRLWDLRTYSQIGPPLTGHSGGVRSVVFSPDGRTLATASDDKTARLWKVPLTPDPVAAACARTGRSLTRAEWRRFIPDEKYRKVCD